LAIWPPTLGDNLARRQAFTVPARVLAAVRSTVPTCLTATSTGLGRVARQMKKTMAAAASRTRVQRTIRLLIARFTLYDHGTI
jgi:ABC-type molybdate transport system permease subunit